MSSCTLGRACSLARPKLPRRISRERCNSIARPDPNSHVRPPHERWSYANCCDARSSGSGLPPRPIRSAARPRRRLAFARCWSARLQTGCRARKTAGDIMTGTGNASVRLTASACATSYWPRPAIDVNGRLDARREAERLIGELRANMDLFAESAMRHSRCPSKDQGGYLGWLQRGQTTPEFDRQVFRLGRGLAACPIESRWGYHVRQH